MRHPVVTRDATLTIEPRSPRAYATVRIAFEGQGEPDMLREAFMQRVEEIRKDNPGVPVKIRCTVSAVYPKPKRERRR